MTGGKAKLVEHGAVMRELHKIRLEKPSGEQTMRVICAKPVRFGHDLIVSTKEGMVPAFGQCSSPAHSIALSTQYLFTNNFQIPSLLLYLVIGILIRERLSLFSHLFPYLFISFISMCSWFLFYSVGIICYYNEIFDVLIVPDLTNSSFFKLASMSFDMSL